MVKWKTSVVPIYLRNREAYDRVCRFNPENGDYTEVERVELPDSLVLWRGYYKKIEKVFIGVFASEKGPVLFVNKQMYLLKKGLYRFNLVSLENENEFSFFYEGNEKFSIKYPRIKSLWTNPYEDEEFVDLIVWLYNNMNDEDFYNYYTMG